MSVSISSIGPHDGDRWDSYVERSPQGTAFHRYDALETQANHADAAFYPLVGYKGEEPVGLFPVFATAKGPLTMAFSPPYELGVPSLGPALLNVAKLKQRKREQRHRRFVEGCLDWIDDHLEPRYLSVTTGWRYDDVRPFAWNGFDVDPVYTYVVDLDADEAELLGRFSQSARRHVRNADDGYAIEEGDAAAARWIIRRMNDRYVEQGREPVVSPAFVADLHDALPDGVVRPYVLSFDGEPATGMVLLECGDTARSWLGGATPDVDLPVNDLLEWHMMREALDRGLSAYEIVGANTPRLNEWKTKFSPTLKTHYTARRAPPGADIAERAYLRLRDGGLPFDAGDVLPFGDRVSGD